MVSIDELNKVKDMLPDLSNSAIETLSMLAKKGLIKTEYHTLSNWTLKIPFAVVYDKDEPILKIALMFNHPSQMQDELTRMIERLHFKYWQYMIEKYGEDAGNGWKGIKYNG